MRGTVRTMSQASLTTRLPGSPLRPLSLGGPGDAEVSCWSQPGVRRVGTCVDAVWHWDK